MHPTGTERPDSRVWLFPTRHRDALLVGSIESPDGLRGTSADTRGTRCEGIFPRPRRRNGHASFARSIKLDSV